MKLFRSAILFIFIVLLLFTSCMRGNSPITESTNKITDEITSDELPTSTLPETTIFVETETETQATTLTETNPIEKITTEVYSDNKAIKKNEASIYGKYTKTDKTFTGLEPLPLVAYEVLDPQNERGLDTKLMAHGFGVASNSKPHSISVDSQMFFNKNNIDALTVDLVSQGKYLYLTFDVGYENGYTSIILDVLKEKQVTTTFFCTLPQMKAYPELIARMITEGHIVGNHSNTHPSFAKISRTQMKNEIKQFDDYIREKFGYFAPFFRYPMGEYSLSSLDLVNALGFKCVFWSIAYRDWELDNQKGADYAFETVTSRLHPGAVILLHSVSPDNANAIGRIIDHARSEGYKFMPLTK